MKHTIDYYVSKLEFYISSKIPNLYKNSFLNNINIKLLLGIYIILIFILLLVLIISTWKLFKNKNKPGYYALIPGLNLWILFKISGLKGYLSLIIIVSLISMFILINNMLLVYALIPLIIIICMLVILFAKLSITYNKGMSYSLGLVFLPFIFFPMLAFDNNTNNEYIEIVNLN